MNTFLRTVGIFFRKVPIVPLGLLLSFALLSGNVFGAYWMGHYGSNHVYLWIGAMAMVLSLSQIPWLIKPCVEVSA